MNPQMSHAYENCCREKAKLVVLFIQFISIRNIRQNKNWLNFLSDRECIGERFLRMKMNLFFIIRMSDFPCDIFSISFLGLNNQMYDYVSIYCRSSRESFYVESP